MPDAIKFVVPTERKTRSHGANRMVTEVKTKYQGYVFAKLRLCPQVYEAIQELDLLRSWMGTVNHKGYKKLPPVPVALNEDEIENFGLEDLEFEEEDDDEEEDEDGVIVDTEEEEANQKDPVDTEALKQYLGIKVEDMVKVTRTGKFLGEDGIVRRLKDGKILVRFFTYGSMFEEWMEPGDVRKLNNEEVLRGLSGPSQPVTQRDFDDPDGRSGGRYSGDGSRSGLRQNLMGNVKGARGPRNRRQDRVERGGSRNRDIFGRTEQERKREERNWNWYQEKQRAKEGRGQTSGEADDQWNFRAGRTSGDDWAAGDVDSQWGRPSQRRQRKERQQRPVDEKENRRLENAVDGQDDWSKFVSPASSKSDPGEDEFFASLMSDLSDDLDDKKPAEDVSSPKSKDDDDFFASLMSELSTEENADVPRGGNRSPPKDERVTSSDDDFFASLEAELGNAFEESGSTDDSDDFFAKMAAEMTPEATSEKALVPDVGSVDFAESSSAEEMKPERKVKTRSVTSDPAPPKGNADGVGGGDLSKHTVPVLKDMLRERGLKVSGKKSELIERLQQS